MKTKGASCSAAAILFAAAIAYAGVVPGRWEKMEALLIGTAVLVHLVGGERLECTLNKIGQDEITFLESTGKERRLPRSAVLKIETAAVVRDRLRNGILIGALVGAAAGMVAEVIAVNAKTGGPVFWDGDQASYLIGFGLVGGGIGAATGAIVDASLKNREVLYQAR